MDEDHVKNEHVEEQETKTKSHKYILFIKEYKTKFLIGGGILFICIYAFGCIYYQNRFMSRTTINGMNVAGINYQKATQKIQEHIDKRTMTLIFLDGEKEILTQENIGFTFNQNNDIKKEIKKQNAFLWFTHWFYQDNITINNLFIVDEKKLETSLSQLKHLQDDYQVAPAYAKVQYKDHNFSIAKETIGSKIQKDILIQKITTAFQNGETELNVEEVGGYVKPKTTSEDESLKKLLEAAKKYCDVSITYKTINEDVVLDGNTLVSWLSIDESGNYYKDDNEFKKQATEFVKKLSKNINIIGKKKTFTGAHGRKINVSGGNYGYKLKQEKEVEGLLKDIQAGKKGMRTPVTTGIQASYDNGGLGQTFIEIDMTKQHFWYHKNGKIVLESDIVSGLPSDPHKKTPAGTYYIYFMQLNRTLRGEIQADGKPEYETPVAYWMAFNGGIGLHDATWQSRFGGDVYYTRGSHGCINLPLKVAAELYDMVKVNTPVVCYY